MGGFKRHHPSIHSFLRSRSFWLLLARRLERGAEWGGADAGNWFVWVLRVSPGGLMDLSSSSSSSSFDRYGRICRPRLKGVRSWESKRREGGRGRVQFVVRVSICRWMTMMHGDERSLTFLICRPSSTQGFDHQTPPVPLSHSLPRTLGPRRRQSFPLPRARAS